METVNLDLIKADFQQHVENLQDQITNRLLEVDPTIKLIEDRWQRTDFESEPGGGGITRVFTGEMIENAGVNTSLIYGAADPQFVKTLSSKNLTPTIWACGISLIIHPKNPRIPTTHANFRLLHIGEDEYWFGGGGDLTPYYPHEEDFAHFHQTWADACAPYGCYQKMKAECDRYFTNTHRQNEMRGIGGIFFDHYRGSSPQADLKMVKELSEAFIPSYFPLVEKRKNEKWTAEDEDFQLHRRGRYVEFNLIHDRGTLFGLRTNGRTDSILVSLPARCKFTYRYSPKTQAHEKMMKYYHPHDWIKFEEKR